MARSSRIWTAALLAGAVGMAAALASAEPQAAPAAAGTQAAVMSPEQKAILDALLKLSSDEYRTREDAVAKIQEALALQMRQLVAQQELLTQLQLGMARQLESLTLEEGIESKARVAGLLEYNQALARWTSDVMLLPDEQRKSFLDWGMTREGYTLAARVYARKPEARAQAARDLVKTKHPAATWLLLRLLNDESREVALRTADVIWTEPLPEEVMDLIWDRALSQIASNTGTLKSIRNRSNGNSRQFMIRGIQVYLNENNTSTVHMQDYRVYAEMLIARKEDQAIAARLDALFQEMQEAFEGGRNDYYRWQSVLSSGHNDGLNIIPRLIETHKPKAAVRSLYKIATTAPAYNNNVQQINNQQYYMSLRVHACAAFVKATGQPLEDYNLVMVPNYGSQIFLKGGQEDEEKLTQQVKAWWKDHAKEYGAEPPKDPVGKEAASEGLTPAERTAANGIDKATLEVLELRLAEATKKLGAAENAESKASSEVEIKVLQERIAELKKRMELRLKAGAAVKESGKEPVNQPQLDLSR